MTIIGVDASYTRTGIGISIDGKLVKIYSIKFKGCKSKPEKRAMVRRKLQKYISIYNPQLILIERTRQFSTSDKPFIAMNMIKTGISIQTAIVDVAFDNGLEVRSVDTRAWKSQVVGTSKAKGSNKKQPTIDFVEDLGIKTFGDDDAADAGCISLFYWKAEEKSGPKRRDELMRLEE